MRRQGEPDRVGRQVHPVEVVAVRAGVPRVLLRDHEVEVACGDLEQADVGLALGHLDAQVGVLAAEQGERLRHHGVGRRLEHGDAHRAADRGERARDIRLGLFEAIEHGARVAHEQLRLRGELHPPADLHEQRHARLAFELAELLRHGGRAVRQRLGDGREGAALAELHEQPQPSDVEHRVLLPVLGDHSVLLNSIHRIHSLYRTDAASHTDPDRRANPRRARRKGH